MSITTFFNSFTKKRILTTLLYDTLSFGAIGLLMWVFAVILNQRAYAISGGQGPVELKAALLVAGAGAQELISNLQFFVYFAVFGSIFVVALSLGIAAYSRARVWAVVLGKKFEKNRFWRWVGLFIIYFFLSMVYILIVVLLRSFFAFFIESLSAQTFALVVNIFNLSFLLLFIVATFILFDAFSRKYKVFEAVGEFFLIVSKRWSKLWRGFLLTLIVLGLLSILFTALQQILFTFPNWIYPTLYLIVTLLFLSWIRSYVADLIVD